MGFSTLTPLPGPNVGELPPITVSTFIARTPENMPLTNHASTSANPDPAISLTFVEVNYEVLKSLLRERRRQMRNEDLCTKLEYYSEEYDEEREMEPRPTRVRETTPILRAGSPRAQRQRGRVVEFEEAPNRDGSRVTRESEGRRHLERRAEYNENCRCHSYAEMSNAYNLSYCYIYSQRLCPDMVEWSKSSSDFVHGLKTRSLMKFLSTDFPTTYKGLMEKTYTWIEEKEVTTNRALNDHQKGFDRFNKGSPWYNKGKKKNRDRFSPYRGSNHGLLSNLSKTPREILATEKVVKTFEQPPCMVRSRRSRDVQVFPFP
ncbi:hypothetical protein Tco_0163727 [Tanacetum coccineum]